MTNFEAIVLGIVQSLTEFFPISSSAHLIILPNILGWDVQSLTFDLVLHMGTSLALIFFFHKDLYKIFKSFFKDIFKFQIKEGLKNFGPDSRMGLYLLVGTLPAVILGLLFGDFIEENVRDLRFIVFFLILGTIIMILAEMTARKKTTFKEMGFYKSLFVGFFQSLALLPGVSRSGATMSGGIFVGLNRPDAAKFAFLLALPVILGAGVLKISSDVSLIYQYPSQMLLAFLSSFIFGLLALKLLTLFLKKGTFMPFIVYRIFLTIFLLIYISSR